MKEIILAAIDDPRVLFLFVVLVYILRNFVQRWVKAYFRSQNIREQGWPPPHLDADGDLKPEPEER